MEDLGLIWNISHWCAKTASSEPRETFLYEKMFFWSLNDVPVKECWKNSLIVNFPSILIMMVHVKRYHQATWNVCISHGNKWLISYELTKRKNHYLWVIWWRTWDLFCFPNLSVLAIVNFVKEHECSESCGMLALQTLSSNDDGNTNLDGDNDKQISLKE